MQTVCLTAATTECHFSSSPCNCPPDSGAKVCGAAYGSTSVGRSHSTLLQLTAKEPEVRALGILHPEASLLGLEVTSLPVLI